MRYLGIDYGTKKVGLALSDEAGTMGFPHAVVLNDSRLMDDLLGRVSREKVGAIVMGESRDFSGNENPVAKEAKVFGETLAARAGIPLFFEPEMLTTQEARRDFEGVRQAGSGRVEVDSSAAALILTSYLSHT